MPPTASPPDPAPLIPDADAVKARLSSVCREARLLRRLLKLARDAGLPLTTAAELRAVPARKGGRTDG